MSSEDVDDLYSDLYGDTGAYAAEESPGEAQPGAAQQQLPEQQQQKPAAAPAPSAAASSAPAAAPSRSSFIPQSGGGSFIPPPASSTPYNAAPAPAQHSVQSNYRPAHDHYNSGSSGSLAAPASNAGEMKRVSPHEMPDEGKMFVGGLNWETSEEKLARHFGQYGKVIHCTIMKDPTTGRSRGFGFLTFEKAETVNVVLVKEHFLDGKIIDPKRAISRNEGAKTARVFVGSIPQSATSPAFEALFKPFGIVTDANLMMDNATGKPRGYGFVTFADDSTVDAVLAALPLFLDGKQLDVKRAQPRVERDMRKPREGTQGNFREQRGGYSGSGGSRDGMSRSISQNSPPPPLQPGAGTSAAGAGAAFDPQAMAALFQQTGWGNNFNPMMFQQMMMGGAMGNMPMGMPGMAMGGMAMPGMMGMPQMGGWGGMPQQGGMMPMGGGGGGMGQQNSPQGYHGGQGQRRHSPNPDRGGSADLYRPLPRPMGLPARPDVAPPPRPSMEGDRNFTGVQPQYVAHDGSGYDRDGSAAHEVGGNSRRSRSPSAAKTLAGGAYSERERSPQRQQGGRDRY